MRAPFNQVVQVAGMACSAERSEESTNAMVRAPVKGARMRSERGRSLLVVPMKPANAFRAEPAEGRGGSGQGARGGIDGGNTESTDHLNETT